MDRITRYTCGCATAKDPPPDGCPTGEHENATPVIDGLICACGKEICRFSLKKRCPDHTVGMLAHHTDGSTDCPHNFRTPEEVRKWDEDHAKWKTAQAKLPDLAAVMKELDAQANPLSFDGHDNFKFVKNNPEEAAICIHHMYRILCGIAIGKKAMAEIPVPRERR